MAKVLLGLWGWKIDYCKRLGPNYLDMDALIEKRLGMSIANFFAEKEKQPSSGRIRSPS